MQAEFLVACGVAVIAIAASVRLEWRYDARETGLRRKLGAARTALEVAEARRDRAEAECHEMRQHAEGLTADREEMRRQFNAQALELARYRGMHPSHHRLTRVYTGIPEPPEAPPEDEG